MDQIIKYNMFRQASAFTSFHKKLGVLIEPFLDERWTLLDAGCGLGLIDLAIAPVTGHITAIDIEPLAIAELEMLIDAELRSGRGAAGKIEPICADMRGVSGEWDIILMSFYGADLEETARLMSMARRRVIFIVHGRESNGRFDPAPSASGGRRTVEELEHFLNGNDYRFRKSIVDLQFGQPFRTIEDIHEFLGNYNYDADDVDIAELSDALSAKNPFGTHGAGFAPTGEGFDIEKLVVSTEERIIKTDRFDYPYYLPRNMCVAIVTVIV